ncbi:hypothetical protein K456DRAFT_334948 [Colletotrichum gloeosporioides 23]|nr:hypothetical protein K456DRAFT_334948 [Colletotrichum gloeosporioides 23]
MSRAATAPVLGVLYLGSNCIAWPRLHSHLINVSTRTRGDQISQLKRLRIYTDIQILILQAFMTHSSFILSCSRSTDNKIRTGIYDLNRSHPIIVVQVHESNHPKRQSL